jgi:CubicO group peptidase (beta-lactamase class C family)
MKPIILLLLPLQLLAQKSNQSELDKFIKSTTEQVKAAGASVLVAQQGKIILNKGYGFAHLGFRIPATPQTKYFIVGPQTIVLATAIMQQVEKGNLSLDDEIQKYLPDFPLQGKKVLIRHLITSTSGIPDYHYLGDAFTGHEQPKTQDEVINLFAGKPFLMEPGTKFDHSISNSALLTAILEKITQQRYRDYLQANFIDPLSLQETEYLEQDKVISNFAQGYKFLDTSFYSVTESLFTYDYSRRLVSTTGDLYKLWDGLKKNRLITASSFTLMISREEAIKNNSGNYGYGIGVNKLENFEVILASGSLRGYSGLLYYIPEKDITIIVLSNSDAAQEAAEIGRRIVRKMLGLPPPPFNSKKSIADLPVPNTESSSISGTYAINRKLNSGGALTNNTYKRTVRVFVENDRLMLQMFGRLPQLLLKQEDSSFRVKALPTTIIKFLKENDKTILSMISPEYNDTGTMIGNADAKTFHGAAFENLK